MRNIYSLTILSTLVYSALAGCSDSSSTINRGPTLTATVERLEQFEDYSPLFSEDGSKAVFLSNRSSLNSPLVYFYDASAATKVVRLDDQLGLDAADGKESLVGLNKSASLVVFSRTNIAAKTNQIIAAQTSGSLKASIDLPAGATVSELSFARGSENYFAYVQRLEGVKTLKVVKVSSDTSAVTFTEIESLAGQDAFSFQLVNNSPTLISFGSTDTNVERTASIQTYDENASAWTVSAETFKVKLSSLERPYSVSPAGLFTFTRLSTPKVRLKQGTGPTVGQDLIGEKVAVSDSVSQLDVFGSALTYDFANSVYTAAEPLSITSASGSTDGQYLVLSGYESLSCQKTSPQLLVQKLIRQSDMKMVSLTFTRPQGTQPWTGVVTDPCAVYDEGAVREIDPSISKADFVGKDGEFFILALHSFATVDEEIRLAKFKVDFDAGTVSELTISEITDNHR